MKIAASFAPALLCAALCAAGPGSAGGPPAEGPPADRAAAARRPAAESPKQKVLQALLYTDLTVNFEQTPARDVFDFLRTALGVKVEVRYAGPGVAGIEPELPITIEARDMPAWEMLDQVLEQCAPAEECSWQVRRGMLEIGTKDRLSVPAARETRWYRVDELTFEAPDFNDSINMRLDNTFPYDGAWGGWFTGAGGGWGGSIQFQPTHVTGGAAEQRGESLVDLIVTVVEPSAWTNNGGDRASIMYRDGVLIVNAPDYIQRKLFGYPRVPRPPAAKSGSAEQPAAPASPAP
jgi:hypothetical protein